MAIKVTCESCGKELQVSDQMAGKKGKCPACKSVLVVPDYSVEVEGDEQESESGEGGAVCPNCGKELEAGDVFCVECGTNLETGKQIKGL